MVGESPRQKIGEKKMKIIIRLRLGKWEPVRIEFEKEKMKVDIWWMPSECLVLGHLNFFLKKKTS